MEMILEKKTNVKLNYFLPTSQKYPRGFVVLDDPPKPTRICSAQRKHRLVSHTLIHTGQFAIFGLCIGGFSHQLCGKVVIFDLEFSRKPTSTC
jgi:hypothetical protein